MSDLISKQAAIKAIYALSSHSIAWLECAIDEIEALSTIEAEPIKHGHDLIGGTLFECSECGYYNDDITRGTTRTFNYCPNCGARMDAERAEKY